MAEVNNHEEKVKQSTLTTITKRSVIGASNTVKNCTYIGLLILMSPTIAGAIAGNKIASWSYGESRGGLQGLINKTTLETFTTIIGGGTGFTATILGIGYTIFWINAKLHQS